MSSHHRSQTKIKRTETSPCFYFYDQRLYLHCKFKLHGRLNNCDIFTHDSEETSKFDCTTKWAPRLHFVCKNNKRVCQRVTLPSPCDRVYGGTLLGAAKLAPYTDPHTRIHHSCFLTLKDEFYIKIYRKMCCPVYPPELVPKTSAPSSST